MNYIAEINCFEQWLETNHLPVASQLLWYKLMSLCNRCGWEKWITVDNQRLMSVMQMSREGTFIGVRNKLIEAGLLEYKKGKKGFPNQYKLCSFTFKTAVQSEVQSEVQSVVQTEVQSVDINKQNKTKLEKKDTNVSKEKFKKPSLEEIRKYCVERNNGIDAQRFLDFYKSKGWMVGKTPMKDWKASIRTWEKNEYSSSTKENQTRGGGEGHGARNKTTRDTTTGRISVSDEADEEAMRLFQRIQETI